MWSYFFILRSFEKVRGAFLFLAILGHFVLELPRIPSKNILESGLPPSPDYFFNEPLAFLILAILGHFVLELPRIPNKTMKNSQNHKINPNFFKWPQNKKVRRLFSILHTKTMGYV